MPDVGQPPRRGVEGNRSKESGERKCTEAFLGDRKGEGIGGTTNLGGGSMKWGGGGDDDDQRRSPIVVSGGVEAPASSPAMVKSASMVQEREPMLVPKSTGASDWSVGA